MEVTRSWDPFTELTVFKLPGAKPDVRFKTLDSEIHAHSSVLKSHSVFFRKFLDSPDKMGPSSTTSFHYEWVSEVEADQTWHVVPATSVRKELEGNKLGGQFQNMLKARIFVKLLCSFYRQPYFLREHLLANKLSLHRGDKAGEGKLKDYFLCAFVRDDELP